MRKNTGIKKVLAFVFIIILALLFYYNYEMNRLAVIPIMGPPSAATSSTQKNIESLKPLEKNTLSDYKIKFVTYDPDLQAIQICLRYPHKQNFLQIDQEFSFVVDDQSIIEHVVTGHPDGLFTGGILNSYMSFYLYDIRKPTVIEITCGDETVVYQRASD